MIDIVLSILLFATCYLIVSFLTKKVLREEFKPIPTIVISLICSLSYYLYVTSR